MDDNLLNCPFCGGGAQISRAHQNKMLAMGEVATDEHYLFTLHHACNPTLNDGVAICWAYKPKAALIAAWNRRTPAPVSGNLREVVARASGALDNIRALAVNNYDMTGDGNWGNVEGFANSGLRALSALTRHIAAEEREAVAQWCSGCQEVRSVDCYRAGCPKSDTERRAAETLAAEREREAFAERVFRHGFSDGWTANQKGRLAASASVDEAWHFYVADGALQKSVALTANHSAPVVGD